MDKKLLDALLANLRHCPQNWSRSEFRVTHVTTGLNVWIANGPAHLEVFTAAPNIRRIGGFNPFGFFVPWRRKLYRALSKIGRTSQAWPVDTLLTEVTAMTPGDAVSNSAFQQALKRADAALKNMLNPPPGCGPYDHLTQVGDGTWVSSQVYADGPLLTEDESNIVHPI